MKFYECDCCGEIQRVPYDVNIFTDLGWEVEELKPDGSPVVWQIDEEKNWYTYDVIATVKHYCPTCSLFRHNIH